MNHNFSIEFDKFSTLEKEVYLELNYLFHETIEIS